MRFKLTIAYDGRGFHGAAANEGVRTVVGELADALGTILRGAPEITLAGRTDAGVHARGQVVSFDAPDGTDAHRLGQALTSMLGPEIVVHRAEVVGDDFDARFSATARRYQYRIENTPVLDPLLSGVAWHVPDELRVSSMQLACDGLVGEHDFSSFCRRPKGRPDASLTRHVRRLVVTGEAGGRLDVGIEANAFCHQMVRSIVGLLVSVGIGRVRAGDVRGILAARDRNAVPRVAPPDGLVLEAVTYADLPAGA